MTCSESFPGCLIHDLVSLFFKAQNNNKKRCVNAGKNHGFPESETKKSESTLLEKSLGMCRGVEGVDHSFLSSLPFLPYNAQDGFPKQH